jgi:hypothetical protein
MPQYDECVGKQESRKEKRGEGSWCKYKQCYSLLVLCQLLGKDFTMYIQHLERSGHNTEGFDIRASVTSSWSHDRTEKY